MNGDFIQRHAEAVSLQHKVSVLHIISDKNCTKTIEINSVTTNNIATHIAYLKSTKNPIIKTIRFYKAFKKLLNKIGYFDVIHLNKIYPFGIFTFFLKKPYIISEHWTGYNLLRNEKISLAQLWLSKLITIKAAYVCPVSNELMTGMQYLKLNGNYKVIPNVVDTELFFPIEKKRKSTFTILHISNMIDDHKNVSGILKAVSKLDDNFKLIIIGQNSSKYRSLANKLSIEARIDFIEHLSHTNIPKYIQRADVYISFSNYETWGIVMIEAYACGIPIIATNTGIINELQPLKATKIINKNDEEALLEAIIAIKQQTFYNGDEMHSFVKNNFSPSIVAKQFSELYFKSIS